MKQARANVTVVKIDRELFEQLKDLQFAHSFRTRRQQRINFDDYERYNEDGGVDDSSSEER